MDLVIAGQYLCLGLPQIESLVLKEQQSKGQINGSADDLL